VLAGQTIVLHTGDTATTVIAVLGLALAAFSFGWQAWSVAISGSRVKVTVHAGMVFGDNVASFAKAPTADELQGLVRQGFKEPVYLVKVYNRGRGATSVTDVDLCFSDRTHGAAAGSPATPRGRERCELADRGVPGDRLR
jgi:hypothetical protein